MSNPWIDDNYEEPKTGGKFTEFSEGDTKVRILSKPIMGWEQWKDNKPVRIPYKGPESMPKPIVSGKKPKHFFAFVVWNYETEDIQVCQVRQATILKTIKKLFANKDWGDPRKYDITINKSGEGMDSEYSVLPSNKKKPAAKVLQALKDAGKIELTRLYKNEDPFVDDVDDDEEEIEPVSDIKDTGSSDLEEELESVEDDEADPWD